MTLPQPSLDKQGESQIFVYVGLFIGAVITTVSMWGFYSNMKIEDLNPIGVPIRTIPVANTSSSSAVLTTTPVASPSSILYP